MTDRYGGDNEKSPSDLQPEWTSQKSETGLEEPVCRLGLGGDESYPERPNEANCIYYLRTGVCGYGSRCRFNHPPRNVVEGHVRHERGKYPERISQPECQYYMRTGMCKFGVSCKYHHPRQGGGSVDPVGPILLNYYGYPLRPGERECSYYAKTGLCSFGSTCKFHHPHPHPPPSVEHQVLSIQSPAVYPQMQSQSLPSSQQYGVVVAGRPPLLPSSYIHSPYGPVMISPNIVSFPGWAHYPTSMSPVERPSTQPTVDSGTFFGITQLTPAPAYTGSYQSMPSSSGGSFLSNQLFPDRPGQPECQYFIRTGNCKFGSSCKYHHPPELVAPKTDVFHSSLGLPLRPGAAVCTHFVQHGFCKFGPACKFDHSIETLDGSSSGLADMQFSPYPV